jgi:GT2 family glycosyltransferase
MGFDKTLRLALIEGNQRGLPAVYNQFIHESLREEELVFLHDDLWLDDLFLSDRIRSALAVYDVVGLAGNTRLVPGMPAWHIGNQENEVDLGHLSGVVCHGAQPLGEPSVYGPTPAAVELLDGVLLAARAGTLLDAGVRFDERFDFHFYDLDFSRQARAAGLKMGTWPIAVTHVSGGVFESDAWKRGLELYREKWGTALPTQ